MPKAAKSSASSATRKKHARKAAGPSELPLPKEKKPKDKAKGKGKEPRQKIYIPPSKPAPVQPDPLDALGLAKQLPAELVVVLRKLAKKDTITKGKALEDLKNHWVGTYQQSGREEEERGGMTQDTFVLAFLLALPVWLHHLPSLFLSSSHRIRLLTAGLHFSILLIPQLREQIVYQIAEVMPSSQAESVLGSWFLATHDVDRQVSHQSKKSWDLLVSIGSAPESTSGHLILEQSRRDLLISFLQRALLDPSSLYTNLNPVQPAFIPSPLPGPRKGPARQAATQPSKHADQEAPVRSKPDEEDESEEDRRGRLRCGALGGMKWFIEQSKDQLPTKLSDLLSTPELWTGLYHGTPASFCPDRECLGHGQVAVRKSTWAVLYSLLRTRNEEVEHNLSILSSAILRSAWVEPDQTVRAGMWEPLLTFLTGNRQAWEIDMAAPIPHSIHLEMDSEDDENSHSENESTTSHDGDPHHQPALEKIPLSTSESYREFLQFLQLGCSGSPIQGYPTILVILSTIPYTILGQPEPGWVAFFDSFWASLDGRALSALERGTTAAAFLGSLLECLVFLVKRSVTSSKDAQLGDGVEEQSAEIRKIIHQQIVRTWEELASRRLRLDGGVAGNVVAKTLLSLDAINEELFSAAWDPIASLVKDTFTSAGALGSHLLVAVLGAFNDQLKEGTTAHRHLRQLISDASSTVIDREAVLIKNSEQSSSDSPALRLNDLIDKFSAILFSEPAISKRIDDLMEGNIRSIISRSPTILLTYLLRRQDTERCAAIWRSVLRAMAIDSTFGRKALAQFLKEMEEMDLPDYLRPNDDDLNALASSLVTDVVTGGEEAQLPTVKRLLRNPVHFLSARSTASLIHSVIFAFSERTRRLLHNASATESTKLLWIPLEIIDNLTAHSASLDDIMEVIRPFLPDIFIFVYLFPMSGSIGDSPEDAFLLARHIWEGIVKRCSGEELDGIHSALKGVVRDLLMDVDSRPSTMALLQRVSEGHLGSDFDLLADLFPSKDELDDMLDYSSSDPVDPSLAVIQPLVPPQSSSSVHGAPVPAFDASGYSTYARILNALLYVLSNDRHLVRTNIWALRHFLVLSSVAHEHLHVPNAESSFFKRDASHSALQDVITRVQKVTTLLLAKSYDNMWHSSVVHCVSKVNDKAATLDSVGLFLVDLILKAKQSDSYRESFVLYSVLQHVLSGTTKADADQWMILARSLEKHAPQTSMAITLAVTEYAPEPPRLDRYRNELAAEILGIPPSKANSTGLLLLRKLAATAPDPDSDVVYLPQLRAVNFVKAYQQWVTSDEDIDEAVESEMTVILTHLAPILQNVAGSHWDLIFDMVENNLENCSFNDGTTLVMLARTLKLLLSIRELAETNKALRTAWQEREMPILILIRDLVAQSSGSADPSVPRSSCWGSALSIVQNLPTTLIDHDTLPKMCHLLLDPSADVQKMAYSMLQQAAKRRTEHLVVEAGVDTSGEATFHLPTELLNVLSRALEGNDESQVEYNPFGYMLGWMIIFDLFNDASLKVKMGYASQIRDLGIIATNFLPTIFASLDLYSGRSRAFQLDIWAIDEYYIQLHEPDSPLSLKLLAAHLFYRALLNIPSLIASWWNDCKDRTLSTAISSVTTRSFSPVLIAAELAHVKDPEAAAELSGENWSVKVANATSEVTMAFQVDDEHMEIGIKLPADYPLHGVEVRDIRRIGVDEKRWRGWLLAVQQVVSSQNGRIVDGLSIFKKNVTSHFEDQTECAICYSIISVTELSLPKKRCKTCKNRFHASCLYKWFNTSHTSTCPLCRSDFI
ncbi:hypothetical protein BD410DRAFT_785971 [Rickenella mellea]|uniref:E3 ubiquitin-protein ligase listerin n=1 Tax=Rickenella mellea TaxID=50990 RepID=A0A4Y7Q9Z0_9AGAM|nr:hypothetical protein BD410DRAFT_785971 [Rickenella mellea]